jgi:hypothetical protein
MGGNAILCLFAQQSRFEAVSTHIRKKIPKKLSFYFKQKLFTSKERMIILLQF